jgi:hypothetical protein
MFGVPDPYDVRRFYEGTAGRTYRGIHVVDVIRKIIVVTDSFLLWGINMVVAGCFRSGLLTFAMVTLFRNLWRKVRG